MNHGLQTLRGVKEHRTSQAMTKGSHLSLEITRRSQMACRPLFVPLRGLGLHAGEGQRGIKVSAQGSDGFRLPLPPLVAELALTSLRFLFVSSLLDPSHAMRETPSVGACGSAAPFLGDDERTPDIAQLVKDATLHGHIPEDCLARGLKASCAVDHKQSESSLGTDATLVHLRQQGFQALLVLRFSYHPGNHLWPPTLCPDPLRNQDRHFVAALHPSLTT